MRKLLIVWLAPILFLGLWYGAAANDLGGGMFSREFHDRIFTLYGETLGIEPASIPPLVARALVVDSLILWAIVAFRKRREIADWWRDRRETRKRVAATGRPTA